MLSRAPVALGLGLLVAACSLPERDNPFDPEAPPALQSTATLSGLVKLEPLGDKPASLAGIIVTVGQAGSAVTGVAGAWTLQGVPPGTYLVQASKPGYETGFVSGVTVSLDDGESTLYVPTLSLAVTRGALRGAFVLPEAASSAGIVVTASQASAGFAASALTDPAGGFELSGLPTGSYEVSARLDPDWLPSAPIRATVELRATAELAGSPVALAPKRTSAIEGEVRLEAAGADHSGATLTLTGTDFRGAPLPPVSTQSAVDGAWAFTGLPAGRYQIAVARQSYQSAQLPGVEVGSDSAVALAPLTLRIARTTIAGTVSLAAPATMPGLAVGSDFSGTVVTLTGTELPVAAATTDASGAFRFVDVPVNPSGAQLGIEARRAHFELSDTTRVTPVADATVTAAPITLLVAAGRLTGEATLFDRIDGSLLDNPDSSGVSIRVAGTAFNGTGYAAPLTGTDAAGGWRVENLPPGTYDILASSPDRSCGAFARTSLPPGEDVAVGAVRCSDTIAPGALRLAIPSGPEAQPGFTRLDGVAVAIDAHAGDPAGTPGNFRGYQFVVGAVPDWSRAEEEEGTPDALYFDGLSPNATNTLWARAIDWLDNPGLATSVTVVHDDSAPALPRIDTPRSQVDATTTSFTLSGGEADAHFSGYEVCSWAQSATLDCPAAATSCSCPASGACSCGGGAAACTFQPAPAAFSLSLAADQRTCLFARAVDRAGNAGPLAQAAVTSDLTPPAPARFSPSFDPTTVSIHADYVDFTLVEAATDAPGGQGEAWRDVAWLEIDQGSGFTPLCPAAACHAAGFFDPCGACACSDPRLRCSESPGGTRSLSAIRMPLLGGVTNSFAVRAVDLAGNRGAGLSQQVVVSGFSSPVATSPAPVGGPRTLGRLLTLTSSSGNLLVELGDDERFDPDDTICTIGRASGSSMRVAAEPASDELVVFAENLYPNSTVSFARGSGGHLCPVSPVQLASYPNAQVYNVSASGERAAWLVSEVGTNLKTLYVQEPGTDGLLGGVGSPPPTSLGTIGVEGLFLRGETLLYYAAYRWTVVNADGQPFGPSSPQFTFSSLTSGAGLSSDGRRLATIDRSGRLSVRSPGPSGRFDGLHDEVQTRAFAATVSNAEVAVEGSHAIAFDRATTSHLFHWYAGGDARFGTADDTGARLMPSSVDRFHPSLGAGLSGGLLYFQSGASNAGEDTDVWAYDLAALRWESAPIAATSPVISNRRGAIFFESAAGELTCRTSDGRQAVLGTANDPAADGQDLLLPAGSSALLYRPDGDGLWFTPGAPAPVTLFSAAGSLADVAVGGGRALVVDGDDAVWALNPVAGDLGNGATAVRIDTLSGLPRNRFGLSVHGAHAFFGCSTTGSNPLRACYRHATGAGGLFGGPGEETVLLKRPPANGGAVYTGVQGFDLYEDRIVLSASHGLLFVVLEAGADGSFNTADDVERNLGYAGPATERRFRLAGDFLGVIEDGVNGGRSIWLTNLRHGTRRQLGEHYSNKDRIAVDPTGRVYWQDFVFASPSLFVSAP